MSLILEALKRSEAERRLGESPDLLAPSPAFIGAAPARPRALPWIVGLVGVGALFAASAWWWLSRNDGDALPAQTAPPVAQKAAPAPAVGSARGAAPAVNGSPALLGAPVSTPQPQPVQPTESSPQPPPVVPDLSAPLLPPDTVVGRSPVPVEPPAAAIEPVQFPPSTTQSPPATGAAAPAQAAIAETVPTSPATTSEQPPQPASNADAGAPAVPQVESAATTAEASMPELSDLPLAVRQSLPPLVLNMHLYRATASERVVILDGKRLHEGESEGAIQVVEIRSDGVVLIAQGQRFLLSRLPR